MSLVSAKPAEFTSWGDILQAACQWPEKQGKKRDSPPVRGTTTWSTAAAKAPETKTPDMSESFLSFVRVSHGITEFWSHPVGHFEGIFFSPPSQSNLNNFQLHILTLNLSLMSYLCDYVSLLAKKNNQYAPTVNHSWHFPPFFLSSLRTVGTVFLFFGGIKANSLMLHFK